MDTSMDAQSTSSTSSSSNSPPVYNGNEPLLDDNDDDGEASDKHAEIGALPSEASNDIESDNDEDAHVDGLTSAEREILTLLAVDKVYISYP